MKLISIFMRGQRGRTLIELMISTTIGLLISGMALGIFLRCNSSYRLQDENGRMREDGNYVLTLFKKNIIQSGFSPLFASTSNQDIRHATAFTYPGIRACENGFSSGTNGDFSCGKDGKGFPAIEVMYAVDNNYQSLTGAGADCNGQEPKFNINGAPFNSGDVKYVINRFFLHKKSGDVNASLYCAGNGNVTPQPILGNVEDFVISLGIDSDNDQIPDGYVTASQVMGNSADQNESWRKVRGVMICFQLVSDSRIIGGTAQKYFNCSGTKITSTDSRLRGIFHSVFAPRNTASLARY